MNKLFNALIEANIELIVISKNLFNKWNKIESKNNDESLRRFKMEELK